LRKVSELTKAELWHWGKLKKIGQIVQKELCGAQIWHKGGYPCEAQERCYVTKWRGLSKRAIGTACIIGKKTIREYMVRRKKLVYFGSKR